MPQTEEEKKEKKREYDREWKRQNYRKKKEAERLNTPEILANRERLKKEYQERHGSKQSPTGYHQATGSNGGFTNQEPANAYREGYGGAQTGGGWSGGPQILSGNPGLSDRSDGEFDGAPGTNYAGQYPAAPTGYGDVGQGEPVNEPLGNQIISVLKRGRGRPRKDGSSVSGGNAPPKPRVVEAVPDVLKGAEIEVWRVRLRSAIIGIFKAFDDFINLTVKEKPEEKIMIWSAIDDRDIDILVDARISRAEKSVVEARVVRALVTVYEQFASGLITLPRLWQTYQAYQTYGFELPGMSWADTQKRKRRGLKLVDANR